MNKIRYLIILCLMFTGCSFEPPEDLIKEFCVKQCAKIMTPIFEEKKDYSKMPKFDSQFTVIIEKDTQWGGLCYLDKVGKEVNPKVYVKDAKPGDRLRISILKYNTQLTASYGKILKRYKSRALKTKNGKVEPGKIYKKLTIIAQDRSGEFYGFIDEYKTFVIDARKVGEIVDVKILAFSGTGKKYPYGQVVKRYRIKRNRE